MSIWIVLFLPSIIYPLIYVETTDIEYHLGTKTVYHSQYVTQVDPSGCSLVYIDYILRHGSRYGVSSDYNAIPQLLKSLQAKNPNYHWMSNWINPFPPAEDEQLSARGIYEHKQIGQRTANRFNEIFSYPYSAELFPVYTTFKQRTQDSAKAFMSSVFPGAQVQINVGKENDTILYFHKNCPYYQKTVAKVKSPRLIQYENEILPLLHQLLSNLIDPQANVSILTMDDFSTLFELCGYEIAVFNDTKYICNLFNEDMIQLMEQAVDINEYWTLGGENSITSYMTTNLVNDIITRVDAVINKSSNTKATLRFAHAETVGPLEAALQLFSAPYKNDNRFHSSRDLSFAVNIGFHIYNCDGNQKLLKVQVNEKDFILPQCGNMLCPWDNFKALLKDISETNFTKICNQ